MNVMFISKCLPETSGAGAGARMHLKALQNIVGEQNIFIVDLSPLSKPSKSINYIAYGKYSSKMERVRRLLQGNIYLFSNRIIFEISNIVKTKRIKFVFVDDSYFGRLVKKIKENNPDVAIVSFFHDVKASLFKIWMRQSDFFTKLDLRLGIRGEKISVNTVDKNIVLNNAENELLIKYYGREADYYLPVCVNKENDGTINPYDRNYKKHILFVGTSYKPNIDAMRWFCNRILPKIRQYFDIYIVGRGLEVLKKSITDEDAHIIGFAESLSSYYKYSDVVIAPLKDGGGMKIKTCEALSYGKIFIGSTESLHGYYEKFNSNIIDKLVFQCDSDEEYLDAFYQLKDSKICKCNKELVDLYEKYYSENAATKIIKQIIEETVKTREGDN